jgi:Uma2 family endonuclease
MASGASARKLTYDDYVKFPDDGQRHELIDGVHYVSPQPVTKHQRASLRLAVSLANYLDAHQIGEVLYAPTGVILSNFDCVEPDLLVVLNDQAGIITEKHISGAPAIVIEILSPSTGRRDKGLKRSLYERFGVREYWLVDPARDIVSTFLRSAAGRFVPAGDVTLANSGTLASSLLPGWSIELAKLFRRV